ncbi:MAG: hypothetical protein ACT4OG_04355 [Alphaproteobacteria bacterium]
MNTIMKAALVAATLTGTAIAGAGQASAHSSGNLGVYIGPDSFGLYLGNAPRHRHYGRAPSTYGMWYADRIRYRPYMRARWNARQCFPVTKYGYSDWGRPVLIRATMCYDRFGRRYVVPGSRHIVRTL